MDLRLEVEFSKTELTTQIDSLKNGIDQLGPFSQEIEDKVMQKLRLEWNYHSNAIEGNRLNYGETVAFLMTGITAKGKSLKDHLDIRGHNEAIKFLLDIVKDERDLTETDIRSLHEMILVEPYDSPARTADGTPTKKRITLGEYKTSVNHVKTVTGETHYYASTEETPAKMQELMDWYKEASVNKEIHPLILAALFHYKFVAIHPFDDGNGRLSRILMNLILMRTDYPPVVIKMEDRQVYYSNLSLADTGNYFPFIEFVCNYLTSSLNLYIKAIEGGDIDEPEDIDKEIALFKLELQGKLSVKERKSNENVEQIMVKEFDPLFSMIQNKISEFDDFFYDVSFSVSLNKKHTFFYDFLGNTLSMKIDQLNEKESITYDFYSTLSLKIYLNEFKGLNNFSTTIELQMMFENYEYLINIQNSTFSLTKQYNQSITEEECNLILRQLIATLKNNIQKNL